MLSELMSITCADSNHNMCIDQLNPMNVPYMKLQQRLVVLEEQTQQREQYLAESAIPQQQPQPQQVMPVIHTDSGLRLNGEVLEVNHEMEAVLPGYSAD